jgi:hypothetical protein
MDLSTIIDLLSVIAVVCGLIFAGVELRQYRLSKNRESALELFNTWQSQEFMRGTRIISHLPDNLSMKQVQELVGDKMDDVYLVLAILEGIGTLVYKEELSLKLVEDFFSGNIVMTWIKMRRYLEEERGKLGRDTWGEWTQWLAERVIEREGVIPAVPAYIEHREWKAS